ncbi:MAG: DUF6465 family protein [Candidatus Gastranaerophilales bacterium]|nr:DUF6465 family protein [Candidatus Gastranaerophilales bacterium]
MAASKKKTSDVTTATKAVEDAEIQAVPSTTPVKTEEKEAVKKEEVKKEEAVKKESAKKTPGRKPAAKKATAKAAPVRRGRVAKDSIKTDVHVQFNGKSYSEDDLMKIAKDVWKFDLKQKVNALTSVELYVKPEENVVYYVMNKEFTGHFNI